MVDRTPTNNLSIKMRARRLEQQMKKRDNRYSSKESKQTIAPRDPMKKRGKSYAPNEDMRVVRPYADTRLKFIDAFIDNYSPFNS